MGRKKKMYREPKKNSKAWKIILTIVGVVFVVRNLPSWLGDTPGPGPTPGSQSEASGDPETVADLSTTWGVAAPGEAQPALADSPTARNYYVILDGSGSMLEDRCADGRTKAQVAVEALRAFAQSVPGDTNLGLLAFDETGTSERVTLARDNRGEFEQALLALRPGGATPLRSAMVHGMKALERQAQSQLGYGEYNLVVVTDGEASDNEDPVAVVGHVFRHTPVMMHTIGFCIDEQHSLNQPGKIAYRSAQSKAELSAGLQNVIAEAESFDTAAASFPQP